MTSSYDSFTVNDDHSISGGTSTSTSANGTQVNYLPSRASYQVIRMFRIHPTSPSRPSNCWRTRASIVHHPSGAPRWAAHRRPEWIDECAARRIDRLARFPDPVFAHYLDTCADRAAIFVSIPKVGLEPTPSCEDRILNAGRLPSCGIGNSLRWCLRSANPRLAHRHVGIFALWPRGADVANTVPNLFPAGVQNPASTGYANPESLDNVQHPREPNPDASWAPRTGCSSWLVGVSIADGSGIGSGRCAGARTALRFRWRSELAGGIRLVRGKQRKARHPPPQRPSIRGDGDARGRREGPEQWNGCSLLR